MDKSRFLEWILIFFELLACIAGLCSFRKLKKSYWKWFPLYLAFIVTVEIATQYLRGVSNGIILIANIYRFVGIPFQFLFFFWLLSRQEESSREKTPALWGCIIYLVCWVADTFYIGNIKLWFSSFSYTAGNIILVALIIRFLLKFMNSKEILHYKSSIIFWVTTGMLVFYLGTLPFYGLRNTLYYNYKDIFWIYSYIQLILDCLMYILFTIAFLWGRPK